MSGVSMAVPPCSQHGKLWQTFDHCTNENGGGTGRVFRHISGHWPIRRPPESAAAGRAVHPPKPTRGVLRAEPVSADRGGALRSWGFLWSTLHSAISSVPARDRLTHIAGKLSGRPLA